MSLVPTRSATRLNDVKTVKSGFSLVENKKSRLCPSPSGNAKNKVCSAVGLPHYWTY